MEDKILLSISIPTYNRQEQIQKQVRLLLPQLNEFVELTVYDNNSDTPVKELFTSDELSTFTLVRNSTNIGADANIAKCFENCERKWLWTLSDDDWVRGDAICIVLEEMKKHSDAIFLNLWNQGDIEIDNFGDLTNLYKSPSVFGFSFAMSFCVYNMGKLKSYLRFYYENLNSMTGTLILVLKYAEQYPNSKLCWVNRTCISVFDTEVSWSYAKYIRQSRMFLHAFDPVRTKQYWKTLFRGYFMTNYYLIDLDRKSSNVTLSERFRLLWLSINTQGVLEVLKANPALVTRLFIKLLLKRLNVYEMALKVKYLLINKPVNRNNDRYQSV